MAKLTSLANIERAFSNMFTKVQRDDKRVLYATISANTSLTAIEGYAVPTSEGFEKLIIVKNTSSNKVEVALPTAQDYEIGDEESAVSIEPNAHVDILVVKVGSKYYVHRAGQFNEVEKEDLSQCVKFTAYGLQTIKIAPGNTSSGYTHSTPVLEYSYDKLNWQTFVYNNVYDMSNRSIYLRGIGNTGLNEADPAIVGSTYNHFVFSSNTEVYCAGNAMALLDYSQEVTMSNRAFSSIFRDCTQLVTAPELPSMTLSEYCYNSMFSGCTGLIKAPELPSMTLSKYCYNSMFSGCTALQVAPALPAVSVTAYTYAYNEMFKNCSNLHEIRCYTTGLGVSRSSNWVSGVSSTGTFYKNPALSKTFGVNNIPTGWEVIDY